MAGDRHKSSGQTPKVIKKRSLATAGAEQWRSPHSGQDTTIVPDNRYIDKVYHRRINSSKASKLKHLRTYKGCIEKSARYFDMLFMRQLMSLNRVDK